MTAIMQTLLFMLAALVAVAIAAEGADPESRESSRAALDSGFARFARALE